MLQVRMDTACICPEIIQHIHMYGRWFIWRIRTAIYTLVTFIVIMRLELSVHCAGAAGCGARRRPPPGTGSPGSSIPSWGPSSRTRPCCSSPCRRHPPRRPPSSPRRRWRRRGRSPLSRRRRSFAGCHTCTGTPKSQIMRIHNTQLRTIRCCYLLDTIKVKNDRICSRRAKNFTALGKYIG